ncbi:MAG: hypothetical protein ACI861_002392 [Paracoccaceae bacterium]|jgi:hypothetical protein
MSKTPLMRAELAFYLVVPATVIAVELVFRLRFREVLAGWMGVMKQSTALMRDKTLGDDEKQEKMAKASAATLGGSLKLFGIIALAVAGFAATIGIGIVIFAFDTSLPETLLRSDLQIASLVIAVLWVWGRRFVFR